MAWAGILPPGTLTVVPGIVNQQLGVSMPTFNWVGSWVQDPLNGTSAGVFWQVPSPSVLSVGNRAAEGMDIIPLRPPAANASYTIPVRGPYVQFEPANSSQIPAFDYYSNVQAGKNIYNNVAVDNATVDVGSAA